MKNRICFTITVAGAVLSALAHPAAAQQSGTLIGQVWPAVPSAAGAGDHALVGSIANF